MKTEYLELAENFAKAVCAADFTAARQYLTSWLQKELSAEELQNLFEARLLEMNEVWEIRELIYPAEFTVSGNQSTLADLKKESDWRPPRRFLPELTDENFRQWMVIAFLPDEQDERVELDAWFDLWMAVADDSGDAKIGFFEFEDPD